MASRGKRNGNKRQNRKNRQRQSGGKSPNRYQRGIDEIRAEIVKNNTLLNELAAANGYVSSDVQTPMTAIVEDEIVRRLIGIERRIGELSANKTANASREDAVKVTEMVERAIPLLEAIGSDPVTDRKISGNTVLMLQNSIRRMGIRSCSCLVGDDFDSSSMEAVSMVDTMDSTLDGKVAELVSAASYWMDDDLVRPQAVTVYRRVQRCPRRSRPKSSMWAWTSAPHR